MPQKTPEQREKLARLISEQVSKGKLKIGEALISAGYSRAQAAKGWDSVPDAVKRMLPQKAMKLIKLGNVDPKTQEKIVRGRLVENTLKGKDGGSMSAKILGSDKRLNMWQPEIQQGVVILNPPAAILDNLDHLLESDE